MKFGLCVYLITCRVKPSSQYVQVVARPHNVMWHHAKTCQHGNITSHGISSYCDKSYDVAQNREKSILSNNRTMSQHVVSHCRALQRLASYCELGEWGSMLIVEHEFCTWLVWSLEKLLYIRIVHITTTCLCFGYCVLIGSKNQVTDGERREEAEESWIGEDSEEEKRGKKAEKIDDVITWSSWQQAQWVIYMAAHIAWSFTLHLAWSTAGFMMCM